MEGFWLASKVEEEEADHMDGNGRVGEEYEEDAPFVGEGVTDQGHHLG